MFSGCLESWDWPTESTTGVFWPRNQLEGVGGGWSGQVSGRVGRMFSEEGSCLGPQEQRLPPPPGWASPPLTLVPTLCLSSGCPSEQPLGAVLPASLRKTPGAGDGPCPPCHGG